MKKFLAGFLLGGLMTFNVSAHESETGHVTAVSKAYGSFCFIQDGRLFCRGSRGCHYGFGRECRYYEFRAVGDTIYCKCMRFGGKLKEDQTFPEPNLKQKESSNE